MNIQCAEFDPLCGIIVTIDNIEFFVGDKLTFLDLGFSPLIAWGTDGSQDAIEKAAAWKQKHCKQLPPMPDGRLDSKDFTDDPVIIELAQRAWHNEIQPGEVDIPSRDEAVEALKRRGVPKLLDGRPARIHDGRFEPVP